MAIADADDARMAIAVGPEDVVTAIREDVDAMEKVIPLLGVSCDEVDKRLLGLKSAKDDDLGTVKVTL